MKISDLIRILKDRVGEDLDNIPDYLDSDIFFFPETKPHTGLIHINKVGWNDDRDLVLSEKREMV
jgi:hypothetical protein